MKRYLFAIALLVLFGSTVQAQNQQRRDLIQGLLKGLIESQLEPSRQHPPNQSYRGQPIPGQRGPIGQPGRTVKIEVSPAMLTARRKLDRWNTAAGSLVGELRRHEQSLSLIHI